MVHNNFGRLYIWTSEYEKAKGHFSRAISIFDSTGSHHDSLNWCRIGFASAKAMNNEKDIDHESLYSYTLENKCKFMEGVMYMDIARTLMNLDDRFIDEAEDCVKKAIEADTRNGTRWQLGQDYAVYSDLSKRKGDLPKAREHLSKAIEIMKECGADGWVTRYEKELARL
ncbi:hypothetical protein ACFL0Q_05705 [Thermodesulfobacteriota bacterium]